MVHTGSDTKQRHRNVDSDTLYLVNVNLFAKVIVDWSLWSNYGNSNSNNTMKSSASSSGASPAAADNAFTATTITRRRHLASAATSRKQQRSVQVLALWKHIFHMLNKLLETHSGRLNVYHATMFLKYSVHDKLVHFLIDADEAQCAIDEPTAQSLCALFRNFNIVRHTSTTTTTASTTSSASAAFSHIHVTAAQAMAKSNRITKQLIVKYVDYLNMLHAERLAYIVYDTKDFYYAPLAIVPSPTSTTTSSQATLKTAAKTPSISVTFPYSLSSASFLSLITDMSTTPTTTTTTTGYGDSRRIGRDDEDDEEDDEDQDDLEEAAASNHAADIDTDNDNDEASAQVKNTQEEEDVNRGYFFISQIFSR